MDKYYYLASQLPFLQFNQKTYMDEESFLAEAQKWLSSADFTALCRANINNFYSQEDDKGILRDYKDFERALRQELFLVRGALPDKSGNYRGGLGDYGGGSLPIYRRSNSYRVLKPSVLEGNPLEVEKKLLFLRWQFIEEKQESNFFNLKFLISYFLKLQILKRLFVFNKEKGTVIFDSLCGVGTESHPGGADKRFTLTTSGV
ncbi:MAG: DUF2764 family protein [Candidatus Omnitrophota bacterium]